MEFANVLGDLLEQKEITAYRLAKETGLSQSLISDWRKGKNVPSSDKLLVLSRYFGVSTDYLLGNGNALAQTHESSLVPVYPVIRKAEDLEAGGGVHRYELAAVECPQDYFYLPMAGGSMMGAGILPGTLVLVRKQPYAEDGQIVACLPYNRSATFRRFRKEGDMGLLLAEDSLEPPILLPLEQQGRLGQVILGVAVLAVTSL